MNFKLNKILKEKISHVAMLDIKTIIDTILLIFPDAS